MNRRKVFVGAAFLALAVVAAGAYTWLRLKPIWDVERAVRLQLKDPDSAKFRQVVFNKKHGAGCGYVNAKNSMGGYTGFSHFTLTEAGGLTFEPDTDFGEHTPIDNQIERMEQKIGYLHLAHDLCEDGGKDVVVVGPD